MLQRTMSLFLFVAWAGFKRTWGGIQLSSSFLGASPPQSPSFFWYRYCYSYGTAVFCSVFQIIIREWGISECLFSTYKFGWFVTYFCNTRIQNIKQHQRKWIQDTFSFKLLWLLKNQYFRRKQICSPDCCQNLDNLFREWKTQSKILKCR